MPRWKRIASCTIGTHGPYRILHPIHSNCHQSNREGIRDQHTSPRTTSFHATCLYDKHRSRRGILHIIVVCMPESRYISIAQPFELLGYIILRCKTTHQQRHPHIRHLHILIGIKHILRQYRKRVSTIDSITIGQ